jgi:hypothetical protein
MFPRQGGRPNRIKRESERVARDGTWTRAHGRRRRAGNGPEGSRGRPAWQVQQDCSCGGRRACPAVRRGGQRAGRAGSLHGIPSQVCGIEGQSGSLSLHLADMQAGMQPGLGSGTPGQPAAKLPRSLPDVAPLPWTPVANHRVRDRHAALVIGRRCSRRWDGRGWPRYRASSGVPHRSGRRRTAQRGALRRQEALDPGVIVRRGSSRAVPMAATGLYQDVRPVRFNLAGTGPGAAVVAP